jgi:signal transduction histidine kinase
LKPRTLAALILIVLLPILFSGWLGFRVLLDEQELLGHQVRSLVQERLHGVDTEVQSHFRHLESVLLAAGENLPAETGLQRAFVREHPELRQLFVFAADGVRLFPPQTAPLTEKEARFLERTVHLWPENAARGGRPSGGAGGRAGLTALPRPGAGEGPADRRGWYTWFAGVEQNHIFWWQDKSGRLIGMELEPVRFLSGLIAALPDTGEDAVGYRIRLIDGRGTVAYQWGGHEPDAKEVAVAGLFLSHPLESWKLEYFGAGAVAAGTQWWGLGLLLLAAGGTVLGLGRFLYLEHTREVRLAGERVNFVNQVSHELKTPLTNIRLYAELLEEVLPVDAEEGKPRRYLDIIASESRRLSRLIGNVLTFARQEKGKLKLRPEAGRVDDIVKKTLAAFRPSLAARGVEASLDARADARVRFDPDVLEQILNNLFSNTEKYGASGGRLDVATRQEGAFTTLVVRDYGPGIPKQEAGRVFAPFYRISSRLTDQATGTGIGLGIARQLARLHGGDLTLNQALPGASFEVRLHTPDAGDDE